MMIKDTELHEILSSLPERAYLSKDLTHAWIAFEGGAIASIRNSFAGKTEEEIWVYIRSIRDAEDVEDEVAQ